LNAALPSPKFHVALESPVPARLAAGLKLIAVPATPGVPGTVKLGVSVAPEGLSSQVPSPFDHSLWR
jgi:hypothetical protein